MIVSFTGHRPKKLKAQVTQDWIRDRLREKLIELEPDEAISGMALGFDQIAAQVCLDLGIPFTAAVPFEGQDLDWRWDQQQIYLTLLGKAARVHIVDPVPPTSYEEAVAKLHARNHWMVDHSDYLVAAWDGSKGGTEKCFKYAKKVGIPCFRIQGWPV